MNHRYEIRYTGGLAIAHVENEAAALRAFDEVRARMAAAERSKRRLISIDHANFCAPCIAAREQGRMREEARV